MASWFMYKGIHSEDMGVIAVRYPDPARGAERIKTESIPARYAPLHIREGGGQYYKPVDLSMEIAVVQGGDRWAVLAWLRGDGDLVLGNDAEHARHVWIADELTLAPLGRRRDIWTGTLQMEGDPYRTERDAQARTLLQASSIVNLGNVPSEPLITVYGSGAINLMIGAQLLQLSNVDTSITIDCEAKIAYKGSVLQNHKLTGEWPVLGTGSVPVSWTGSVTSVVIQPRWRWI